MPPVVDLKCFPVVTIRQGEPFNYDQISELYFYFRTEMMLVIFHCL